MELKRYCIVCGNENFSPRSKFCCKKCEQKYYYEQNKQKRKEYKKEYFQEHKEEYAERKRKWINEHREEWNEYNKNRRKGEKENGKDNECCKAI
jgi:hypothetical protein